VGVAHVRALILALLLAGPALAHETGLAQVDGTFRNDGTWTVEITVGHESPAEVAKAARVMFDGAAVPPMKTEIAQDRVRLTGRTPSGVSRVSFADKALQGYFVVKFGPTAEWLGPGQASTPVPLDRSAVPLTRAQIVTLYLKLGFTHIVPGGLDHVLFVLGIFLLSVRLRPVVWQVSAFTVAHTITLALTIYGVVALPPRVVEPLIALSIVYVAIENVFTAKLHAWRTAVVFCFGLLHGMGFAGVLREIGLPRWEFVPALLAFNAGVELGQLAVIFAALALLGAFRDKPWYRRRVVIPGSLAIAAVGLYWTVMRMM
jgi:HupE / UreJ protein